MRRFLIALLGACCSLPALAQSGYTNVIASNVVDAGGNPLASGTITFQVVDAGGHPLPVQVGGFGQVHTEPVSVAVVNGTFTTRVVDVSQTSPSFPCVAVTITDNSTGNVVWQNNCIQPMGPTYDLDMFSANTTPIQPQAGSTVPGNLGVNGNLNVTGNLNIGGLNVGNLSATNVSAESVNGILNAALFPGADIGAKVNNAFATCPIDSCTVEIPPGSYTQTTTILLPGYSNTLPGTIVHGNTATNYGTMHPKLQCDQGAVLNYSGSTYAIQSRPNPAGTYAITGGCTINGNASAKAAIQMYGSNGYEVAGLGIFNFTNGDGILNIGANACHIHDNKITGNWVGLHMMAAPAAASNNCLVQRNELAGNQWGVIDGDVSIFPANFMGLGEAAGVSSPNYGNRYESNDIEGNLAGGIMLGLTRGPSLVGNYFEAEPRTVVLGMTEQPQSSAMMSALYGISSANGGTAAGPSVRDNYFTGAPALHSMVELRAASNSIVDGNGSDGSGTTCFWDVYVASQSYVGNNGTGGVTYPLCQGGAQQTNIQSYVLAGLNLQGPVATPSVGTGLVQWTGNGANLGPGSHYMLIYPGASGRGFCTPSNGFGTISIDSNDGTVYVCMADSVAPGGGANGNAADGNGTWVMLTPAVTVR